MKFTLHALLILFLFTVIVFGASLSHSAPEINVNNLDTPGYDTVVSHERHSLYIACRMQDSLYIADHLAEHGTPPSNHTPCEEQYHFTDLEKQRWKTEDSIRRARKPVKSRTNTKDNARAALAQAMMDSIAKADSLAAAYDMRRRDSMMIADSIAAAEMAEKKKR